jgi:hypothetical protein
MTAVTLLSISCRLTVPLEDVYGEYRREYPPGFEVLGPARRDIRAADSSEEPAAKNDQGLWGFDRDKSVITWYGLRNLVDESGVLDPQPVSASDEDGVEMLWFKVEIRSGSSYPYVKQRSLDEH